MSCGESGLSGEGIEGLLIGADCRAELTSTGGVGLSGQCGGEEPVVDAGDEQSGLQSLAGDSVAVGVREALDQTVGAESSKVVNDLSGAHRPVRRCGRRILVLASTRRSGPVQAVRRC